MILRCAQNDKTCLFCAACWNPNSSADGWPIFQPSFVPIECPILRRSIASTNSATRPELRTTASTWPITFSAPGAFCVLAWADETVAGFIITHRRRTVAHIITIDVLEDFRRMHIGTQLLVAAENESVLHGATRMDLETATTNKAAIALWKKRGYREIGTVKNYFGKGLDAYELQKNLVAPAKPGPARQ